MILTAILAAATGAIAFRIRGGWWPNDWPGQEARGAYAALMACIMLWGTYLPAGWAMILLYAASMWAAWFLGAVWLGTLGAIDAGRNEGTRAHDAMANSIRGMAYTAPPAVVLWLFAGTWAVVLLLLAGACQGACYEAAWRWCRSRQTEIAELATGACFGLGAFAAVAA